MEDETHAEFCGGPCDGQSRWLQGQPETQKLGQYSDGKFSQCIYRIRTTNGVVTRLPNGRYAYDYEPPE